MSLLINTSQVRVGDGIEFESLSAMGRPIPPPERPRGEDGVPVLDEEKPRLRDRAVRP